MDWIMFFSGCALAIAGIAMILRGDSHGIKSVQAIANAKNGEIRTLVNKSEEAFNLIQSLTLDVHLIKNRCNKTDARFIDDSGKIKELWEHNEMMTRSMNLELDILKQRASDIEDTSKPNEPIEIVIYQEKRPIQTAAKTKELLKLNAKKIKELSR